MDQTVPSSLDSMLDAYEARIRHLEAKLAESVAERLVAEHNAEQRERVAAVKWFREIERRTRSFDPPSTVRLIVADEYDYMARSIESGEHRKETP